MPGACVLSLVLGILLFGGASSAEPGETAEDPALTPPPINLAPGAEYSESARIFQGMPGIERAANGRLWATWYSGGRKEGRENYVLLATSGDDGGSWSRAKMVIDPDGGGPVRAFDPCLWHAPDGRLWLFWTQSSKRAADSGLWAVTTDQSDLENPQWTPPRRVCDGVMLNKPTVRSNGEWLLPTAEWKVDNSCRVVRSTDQGKSFQFLGAANVPERLRNCDEPMIVERADGDLWMLVRVRGAIGESVSVDGGKTWSEVARSPLRHTNSRFHVRRLASGKLLLVKHTHPSGKNIGRSHLMAHVSNDDGHTWSDGLLLDERGGVSYPDGVQAEDGTIYIIYDYQRQDAKQILMARITEADIAKGKLVHDSSRMRIVVNQATGERGSAAH